MRLPMHNIWLNIFGLMVVLPLIVVVLVAWIASWRGQYLRRHRPVHHGYWLHTEHHIKRL